MSRLHYGATLVPVLFIFESSALAAPPMPRADSWPGVQSRHIETRAGRVTVRLPDDIRAGDMISGTISVAPTGKTAADQARNRDTLEGMVIEIDGKRAASVGHVLRFAVPAAGLVTLAVIAANGKTRIASTQVMAGNAAPALTGFNLPRLGQAGRPLAIPGNFDGEMTNTNVSIGNKPADVIAESPRQTVIQNPPDATGPTSLRVTEGGIERNTPYRVASVNLSAAKTNLLKGEKTTLTVQVAGLGPDPANLVLLGSPTIQLEGGNAQNVTLMPTTNGTTNVTRNITGLVPGTFDVSAHLALYSATTITRDPLYPGAIDMNGIDTVLHLLGLTAGMNDEAREIMLKATLDALRHRLSDATDKPTRDWLKTKIGIVEALMDRLGIGH
jgi:hypothetical protein